MPLRRVVAAAVAVAALSCVACGGSGSRSQAADLVALHQPTPDPTLDAVVRDLPRALAGVAPTPTPTAVPARPVVRQPTPKPRPAAPTPTATRAARH